MSDQKWNGEDWRDGISADAWEKVKPSAPEMDSQDSTAPPSRPARKFRNYNLPVARAAPVEPASVPASRKKRVQFAVPSAETKEESLDIGAFVKVGYQRRGKDTLHLYKHKKNKLRVVLAPKSSNNVCALSVCFLVGSKAETLGTTGSAHILEHELFKGSASFNKAKGNDIWAVLGNAGVRLNASTSKDRTEFNSTLPNKECLYKALEIEADRLRAPLLQGLSTEYVVVRNEYERGKNNSSSLLREMVFKMAFPMSSTGVPTIGSLEDIQTVLKHAEDLRKFHRKNYCCANCIVVVSGVFGEVKPLLAKIDSCFGSLPAGTCLRDIDPDTGMDRAETEHDQAQRGMRSVDIAGEMPIVLLGYRSPACATSREAIALEVLAQWMSGGQNGMFADMLRDDEDLHSVEIDYERVYGQTLFNVWIVVVSGGNSTEKCSRLQNQMMKRLYGQSCTSDYCMSPSQLSNAKAALDKRWSMEINKSCTSYTSAVVESLSRCNSPFDVFERHKVLESVTLEDVKKTARLIFVPWRCTIGRVLPELLDAPIAVPPCTKYSVKGADKVVAGVKPAARHTIPYNKAEEDDCSVFMVDPNVDTVSLRVHIPATAKKSDIETKLSAALATVGVKLEDGTVLSEAELQNVFEENGAVPKVSGNHTGITLSINIGADRDAKKIIHLLHRALTHPVVSSKDFARKKHFLSAETVGSDFDVNTTASKLFTQCLFHSEGDLRARLSGAEESNILQNMTQSQALGYLKTLAERPAWVTCVGPNAVTLDYVKTLFHSDKPPAHDTAFSVPSVSPQANKIVLHPMDGKTSATMILGCATNITADDPRSVALSLATDSLGGGFTSTLMQRVREDAGLTYGIYSNTGSVDPSTSTFVTQATFAPQLVEKGVNLSRKLVKEWREKGINQTMLDNSKRRALGSVALASDSPAAVCNALHAARLHSSKPAEKCASLADRIKAVTLKEANEAIASLPPFSEFVCVAAGALPKKNLHFK